MGTPTFHIRPQQGWLNDPNGPVYDPTSKLHHIFFQHVPDSPNWDWRIEVRVATHT